MTAPLLRRTSMTYPLKKLLRHWVVDRTLEWVCNLSARSWSNRSSLIFCFTASIPFSRHSTDAICCCTTATMSEQPYVSSTQRTSGDVIESDCLWYQHYHTISAQGNARSDNRIFASAIKACLEWKCWQWNVPTRCGDRRCLRLPSFQRRWCSRSKNSPGASRFSTRCNLHNQSCSEEPRSAMKVRHSHFTW